MIYERPDKLVIEMQSRPEPDFVCYECADGDHARCLGVPCHCPCPLPEGDVDLEAENARLRRENQELRAQLAACMVGDGGHDATEQPVGQWETVDDPDGQMVRIRWNEPDESGRHLYVRHYPASMRHAAEREAREFNRAGQRPWESSRSEGT